MLKLVKVLVVMVVVMSGVAAQFASGSGTDVDPWIIMNAEQLGNVRNYLGSSHTNKHFRLGGNIALNGSASNQWVAIGTGNNSLLGNFDGAGYEVSGVYIDNDLNYQGLFGYIGQGIVSLRFKAKTDANTRGNINPTISPFFTIHVNNMPPGVTHVRVFRTAEIDRGNTDAAAGTRFFFLRDIPIAQDKSSVEFLDGVVDLDDGSWVDWVSDAVLTGSSSPTYGLWGCTSMPMSSLTGQYNGRYLCLDTTGNNLLMSMFPGQDGSPGAPNMPYMYRGLFASNNFLKINEKITAFYGFGSRLFIFSKNKTYSVENANNHNTDGTLRNAPLEISSHIGCSFPKSICGFGDAVYFIDSDGDISRIWGSEDSKTGIKIKAFRDLVALEDRDIDKANAVKAIVWKDMLIFNCNLNQDYHTFRLYCYIDRPAEDLRGMFTYDRGELEDMVIRFGGGYGTLPYGVGAYGAASDAYGGNVSFAGGQNLYVVAAVDGTYNGTVSRRLRIRQAFVEGLFEDEVWEGG